MRAQSTLVQLALPLAEERRCGAPGCDAVLSRRTNEDASHFGERKTCSRECRYRLSGTSKHLTAVASPDKRCWRCGERKLRAEFVRNRCSGDGRAAICRPCAAAYMRERHAPSTRERYVPPEGFKRCGRCGADKPFSAFNRNQSQLDGLQGRCRTCQREENRCWSRSHPEQRLAYYRANRARIVARAVAWAKANRERRRLIVNRYYQKHRDAIRKWHADYRRAHGERLRERERQRWRENLERNRLVKRRLEATRRARRAGATVEVVDYDAILARDSRVCHICSRAIRQNEPLHFDHVVPLARGGAHSMSNIRPAHAECNVRKGARLP